MHANVGAREQARSETVGAELGAAIDVQFASWALQYRLQLAQYELNRIKRDGTVVHHDGVLIDGRTLHGREEAKIVWELAEGCITMSQLLGRGKVL